MFYREIYNCHFFITLFLLSLTASRVRLQDSPQQRCDQGLSIDGAVCNDCLNTYDCITATTTRCIQGTICDSNVYEACILVAMPFAPECYCTEIGCVGDPTNSDVAMQCEMINDIPVSTVGPCNTTEGELIDLDTCSCSIQVCPPCGFLAVNPTEECPMEYEYCANPDESISLECLPGLCFREDFCSCQDIITDCPACGFAPDPLGDAGSFCFCENEPSTCGLQCSDDFTFDTELCQCVELEM